MSVCPSARQRRLAQRLYAAVKAGQVVQVREFLWPGVQRVIDVRREPLGTVYYSTGHGWSGAQHLDEVLISEVPT